MLENLEVVSQTTSSVELAWQLATSVGASEKLHGFRVHYQRDHTERQHFSDWITSAARSYRITKLQPNTYYKVCVHVYESALSTTSQQTCADAVTTGWHIPVSIGSSLGMFVALLVVVGMVVCSKYKRPGYDRSRGSSYASKRGKCNGRTDQSSHYELSDGTSAVDDFHSENGSLLESNASYKMPSAESGNPSSKGFLPLAAVSSSNHGNNKATVYKLADNGTSFTPVVSATDFDESTDVGGEQHTCVASVHHSANGSATSATTPDRRESTSSKGSFSKRVMPRSSSIPCGVGKKALTPCLAKRSGSVGGASSLKKTRGALASLRSLLKSGKSKSASYGSDGAELGNVNPASLCGKDEDGEPTGILVDIDAITSQSDSTQRPGYCDESVVLPTKASGVAFSASSPALGFKKSSQLEATNASSLNQITSKYGGHTGYHPEATLVPINTDASASTDKPAISSISNESQKPTESGKLPAGDPLPSSIATRKVTPPSHLAIDSPSHKSILVTAVDSGKTHAISVNQARRSYKKPGSKKKKVAIRTDIQVEI